MSDYEVRYHDHPEFSKSFGHAEIKCPCGAWAWYGLEHWDDEDEGEWGEWYDIECSECGRKTGRHESSGAVEQQWSNLEPPVNIRKTQNKR